MALDISDVATFAVPENLILLFKDDDQIKGKLHDESIVAVSSDDMFRLDVVEADLPCFAFAADYTASHEKAAINNPNMRSAFAQSAAAAYTKLVAGQKVGKATFLSKVYELTEMIDAVDSAAISVTGENAITVTGEGTEKTIALAIDGKTLSQSANGLKSELTIAKQNSPESGYAATYFLADADGNQIAGSEKINILKDKFLKHATLVWGTAAALNNNTVTGEVASKSSTAIYPFVKLEVYVSDNGSSETSTAIVYIPVDELFHDYSAGNGITINEQVISVLKDSTSGQVRIAAGNEGLVDVLTVGANGVKVDNIQAAIDYAIGVEAAARQAADADLDRRKVEGELNAVGGGKALIFNENDGGGVQVRHPLSNGNTFQSFVGLNDNARSGAVDDSDLLGQIYALEIGSSTVDGVSKSNYGLRLNFYKNRLCYFPKSASGESSNDPSRELAVIGDITSLSTTINTAIGSAATSEAGDGSVYGAIKQEIADRTEHAALDSRHTAEVLIVREATTVATMAYRQYVCQAALTGTLPAAPADGTKRIVSVVAGGEGTVISPASGDKIAGAASSIAINVSNDTVTFVYDAVAGNWIVL